MGSKGDAGVSGDPSVEAWNFPGESVSLGYPGETITLVQGPTFAISQRSGDLASPARHGLFFRDVRLLSRLQVTLNGRLPIPLDLHVPNLHTAHFACRFPLDEATADEGAANLFLFRHRYIGRGMREDLRLRSFCQAPVEITMTVHAEADFASVFHVKTGHSLPDARAPRVDALTMEWNSESEGVGVQLSVCSGASDVELLPGAIRLSLKLHPGEAWDGCLQVSPMIQGDRIEPRFRCNEDVADAQPQQQLEKWRKAAPRVETDYDAIADVVQHGLEELGDLRMTDPEQPDRTLVAAGAPWFMTVFGRDSLLTGWMALLADPDLALGVLQVLASFQGKVYDGATEEEPGKILHELRFGISTAGPSEERRLRAGKGQLSLRDGTAYYYSIDATPLFVMLLGELRRWGLAPKEIGALLPVADAALDWIVRRTDENEDGFLAYQRPSGPGLVNQGWKDSPDAIQFADGRLAPPPIALAEVQGYVYAAYRARAHFAEEASDPGGEAHWYARADALKKRFNERFWLPEPGYFALALDGEGRKVDSLASNMGHCLWTGIVEREKAASVVRHLMSGVLFSDWGIRTLASSMRGYDPASYHRGSIWPHDNAIIASGLMRYGFEVDAVRVIMAVVKAAESRGGRLPELFTGLDRSDFPALVSYPASCSPQAWAAAAPLLFLRTLLGFEPALSQNRIWVHPVLPDEVSSLTVSQIPLNETRIAITVERDGDDEKGRPVTTVSDLPGGIRCHSERRPIDSPRSRDAFPPA